MQHSYQEVELAFSSNFAQDLLVLALEQAQWETHLLQHMKAAVERNDVEEVFHLARQNLTFVWSFWELLSTET